MAAMIIEVYIYIF